MVGEISRGPRENTEGMQHPGIESRRRRMGPGSLHEGDPPGPDVREKMHPPAPGHQPVLQVYAAEVLAPETCFPIGRRSFLSGHSWLGVTGRFPPAEAGRWVFAVLFNKKS